MEELIEKLHIGGYSCVIEKEGKIRTFTRRGVADLYDLYENEKEFMQGACIADKVIGKGAAALIALGKMKEVYTDVISTSALSVLREVGIPVRYAEETPFIINRDKTGRCPLETACKDLNTPEEMYPAIQAFVAQLRNKNHI